jgi:hypothetical protein
MSGNMAIPEVDPKPDHEERDWLDPKKWWRSRSCECSKLYGVGKL